MTVRCRPNGVIRTVQELEFARKISRATKDDLDPCTRSRRRQAGCCHGMIGPTCGDRRSYIREAGNGRPWRGRARVKRYPHACGGTPGLPAYVAGARRPSTRGCVGERGGGPLRVAAGGFSSVFRRKRRCSVPASYGPVARDLVDPQTLDGHGDVVCGDVTGGGIGAVVSEDVLG